MSEKKQELKKLVELFEYNIKQYKGKHYDEAKARADFIDKFFLLLGWDVYNNKRKGTEKKGDGGCECCRSFFTHFHSLLSLTYDTNLVTIYKNRGR